MAAIVPLPPIHLTQRAVEWLTKCRDMVPPHYVANVAWAACWREGTAYAQIVERTGNTSLGESTHGSKIDRSHVLAVHYGGGQRPEMGRDGNPTGRMLPDLVQEYTTPLREDWCCGVADVRAAWLAERLVKPGEDLEQYRYSVRLIAGKWQRTPLQWPTCPECLVELDKVWGWGPEKMGRYRDVVDGKVRFTQWPRPRLAAQSLKELADTYLAGDPRWPEDKSHTAKRPDEYDQKEGE